MANSKARNVLHACFGLCLFALSGSIYAFVFDTKVVLQKAFEQNSLIVRFTDLNPSVVQLRLDGKVIGTRDVVAVNGAGEAVFDLNPSALPPGDHILEAILLSSESKQIGKSSTKISVAAVAGAPVMVRLPKYGDQVAGEYQIDVAIDPSIKKPFVSLFIDRQFREMRNVPPYKFSWDTTKEAPGWHQIEAWAYDASLDTFKSPQIQVFVNNPGGRTDRVETQTTPAETGLDRGEPVLTKSAGVRASSGNTEAVSGNVHESEPGNVTAISVGQIGGVTKYAPVGRPALDKGIERADVTMTGQRLTSPGSVTAIQAVKVSSKPVVKREIVTIKPEAKVVRPSIKASKPIQVAKAVEPGITSINIVTPTAKSKGTVGSNATVAEPKAEARAASGLIAVRTGVHLSTSGYSVFFDGDEISFDVQPTTVNGVPVAPFRHLFEHDGGKIKWDNHQKVLNAKKPGMEVRIQVGKSVAKLNGTGVKLDVPAFLVDGRTIVPLSFMRDALNVDVDYDPVSGHVLVTSKD